MRRTRGKFFSAQRSGAGGRVSISLLRLSLSTTTSRLERQLGHGLFEGRTKLLICPHLGLP